MQHRLLWDRAAPVPAAEVSCSLRQMIFYTIYLALWQGVHSLEVRLPSANGCLHFNEIEVFGEPQAKQDEGRVTFARRSLPPQSTRAGNHKR